MTAFFKLAVFSVLAIVLFLVYSCSDNIITEPSDVVFPDSNVSFQSHVMPVITYNCSTSGCHSDQSMQAGLRLTDYMSYFDSGASLGLVIPNNPDGSRLVQIIENPLFHNPYILWNLNDNHKAGIRKWITEGAKNN